MPDHKREELSWNIFAGHNDQWSITDGILISARHQAARRGKSGKKDRATGVSTETRVKPNRGGRLTRSIKKSGECE